MKHTLTIIKKLTPEAISVIVKQKNNKYQKSVL